MEITELLSKISYDINGFFGTYQSDSTIEENFARITFMGEKGDSSIEQYTRLDVQFRWYRGNDGNLVIDVPEFVINKSLWIGRIRVIEDEADSYSTEDINTEDIISVLDFFRNNIEKLCEKLDNSLSKKLYLLQDFQKKNFGF